MPSRWEVRLPDINPDRVTPEKLHAVVSRWLDGTVADHRRNDKKPYSVSMAHPTDGGALIEIGVARDELRDQLLACAVPGRRLEFDNQSTVLDSAPRQIDDIPWSALDSPSAATAWCIRFVTPTTFKRGNRTTPNTSLKPILGSLRKAWGIWAPPDLAPLVLDLTLEPVWLTDVANLNSEVRYVKGNVVSGFTGRMWFACDATAEVAAAVDRLVRLAPYSGVGAHTTHGFGVVRVEAPRRRRSVG